MTHTSDTYSYLIPIIDAQPKKTRKEINQSIYSDKNSKEIKR
jgi:hypothetical protein